MVKALFSIKAQVFLLAFFLPLQFWGCDEKVDVEPIDHGKTRLITTGHLYYLLDYPDLFEQLIDTINAREPDFVFFLGDLVRYNTDAEWQQIRQFALKVHAPLLFAPGNHDLNFINDRQRGDLSRVDTARQIYLANIGYLDTAIYSPHANLLILNSYDTLPDFRMKLSQMNAQSNPENPTILLSHHALWKYDKRDSTTESWFKKGFHWHEVHDLLEPASLMVSGDYKPMFSLATEREKQVMECGIGAKGDPLFVGEIEIQSGKVVAYEIPIHVPPGHAWLQ